MLRDAAATGLGISGRSLDWAERQSRRRDSVSRCLGRGGGHRRSAGQRSGLRPLDRQRGLECVGLYRPRPVEIEPDQERRVGCAVGCPARSAAADARTGQEVGVRSRGDDGPERFRHSRRRSAVGGAGQLPCPSLPLPSDLCPSDPRRGAGGTQLDPHSRRGHQERLGVSRRRRRDEHRRQSRSFQRLLLRPGPDQHGGLPGTAGEGLRHRERPLLRRPDARRRARLLRHRLAGNADRNGRADLPIAQGHAGRPGDPLHLDRRRQAGGKPLPGSGARGSLTAR